MRESLLQSLSFQDGSLKAFVTGHVVLPFLGKRSSCLFKFKGEGPDLLLSLHFFLIQDAHLFFQGFLQVTDSFEIFFKILELFCPVLFLVIPLFGKCTKFLFQFFLLLDCDIGLLFSDTAAVLFVFKFVL